MYFSTFTQNILIYYPENITREQEKREAQCQSPGLNATINYATFLRQPFATTGSYMQQTCECTHNANHSCNL